VTYAAGRIPYEDDADMKRIIVTGAGGSAAVNFIKSLRMAKEKIFVVGTDISKEHLELSNADKKYQFVPVSDQSYLEKLNRLIELEKVEFVHPQPDVEVIFISENREKINAITFLPDKKTIKLCQNKIECNEALLKAGVPVPESHRIKNDDDLKSAFEQLLPKNSKNSDKNDKLWFRAIKGAGSKASLPIREPEHAKMWMDYWVKMKGLGEEDFMVSEFLPGEEFAFQSIWKNGELVTSQARVRLEYLFGNITPSGQTSTPSIAKTVHRNDVNEIGTKAVLAVDRNATGVFCVDIKENKSGVPCVTEINAGRFFTTSNFFSEAGVNMPSMYVKLAYGESIPDVPKYNPLPEGLYWIRLMDCGHKLVEEGKWTSQKVKVLDL